MATERVKLKSLHGVLEAQPEGPNTPFLVLGDDYELGDVSQSEGDLTAIPERNMEKAGKVSIVDTTKGAPGLATFDVTANLTRHYNLARRLSCPAWFRVRFKDCSNQLVDGDNVRYEYLPWADGVTKTLPRMVTRSEDLEIRWTRAFAALDVIPKAIPASQRITIAEVNAINNISFCNSERCAGARCGTYQQKCLVGYAATDGGAGIANVLQTLDAGLNWAAVVGAPFGAAEDIADVVCNEERVVVARLTADAANPAEVGVSLDAGATFVNYDVGATNNQTIQDLELVRGWKIYAAMSGGDIAVSEDGGYTWVIQNTPTVLVVNRIKFLNEYLGYAVCDTDVILVTQDGGDTWVQCAATGGGANIDALTIVNANLVFIGDDAGAAWYSSDLGVTWNARAIGTPAGAFRSMASAREQFVWALHNTAAPIASLWESRDGGFTWDEIALGGVNAGGNAISVCDENLAWVSGEPQGALGYIGRVLGEV